MEKPLSFLAFGLIIQSDTHLPGLRSVGNVGAPDITIRSGNFPEVLNELRWFDELYVSNEFDTAGRPRLQVLVDSGRQNYYWQYSDGTVFLVDGSGSQIWFEWDPKESLECATTYLLGPVLGFALRLKGYPCLHASAVNVHGSAVAFVGPAGAGKSTTSAVFGQAGYPVISDDVLPIVSRDSPFLVCPSYPQIRLWEDSAEAILGASHGLGRLITHTAKWRDWGKLKMPADTDGIRFHQQSIKLVAIYLLGKRELGLDRIRITQVDSKSAVTELVSNAYSYYVLDKQMRATEFKVLGRLVLDVPVFRIATRNSLLYLGVFRDTVESHFLSLVNNA